MTSFAVWFNAMAREAHANAVDKGFWDDDRNDGELIALTHSELSEALESLRDGNPPSDKLPGFSSFEEEIADAIIRLADISAARGLNVGGAVEAKMAYNAKRPRKHGKGF